MMNKIESLLKESAEKTETYLKTSLQNEEKDLLPLFEAESYSLLGGGFFCKLFCY